MKIFVILAAVTFAAGCSSQKQAKYDYSNVKSTSLDAQIYNENPNHIMKDTVIIVPPASTPKQ